MNILVGLALLPVMALCMFIYFKDKHKEPFGLLALIFGLGMLSVIPVLICELVFDAVFSLKSIPGILPVFFDVLFGVALIEEGFKWLVAKFLGYHNKEFDEIFDIIVYSVFASLGFACVENVMYVLMYGWENAIFRAILAVPGHTCFAISMGYFLSKAKVGQINGNQSIYARNTVWSIVAPILLHTFYDALLMINVSTSLGSIIKTVLFLAFFISMVIVCFITVDKIARVQQNLTENLASGNIARNEQGVLYYNYQTVSTVQNQPASNYVQTLGSEGSNGSVVITQEVPTPEPVITHVEEVPQPNVPLKALSYCPICGKPAKGLNYCGRCGFKLK